MFFDLNFEIDGSIFLNYLDVSGVTSECNCHCFSIVFGVLFKQLNIILLGVVDL